MDFGHDKKGIEKIVRVSFRVKMNIWNNSKKQGKLQITSKFDFFINKAFLTILANFYLKG